MIGMIPYTNRCLKRSKGKYQCVYLIQGDCEGCQVYDDYRIKHELTENERLTQKRVR